MKKLLCGIFAIILIFSAFAACGETENPTDPATTTTTTNNDFKKENLNDYVGYWYIDEQSMDFDKTDTDSYADIQSVYISAVYETEDERAIGVEVYDGTLIYPEYHSRFKLEENSNIVTLPSYKADKENYRLEFKDGQIIFSSDKNSETVLTYKTSDSTAYEAIIDHNSGVFENYYKGYWHMYRAEGESALRDELYIKSFDRSLLTFDYFYGEKHGENVTAELRNGAARFLIDDELTGVLRFDDHYGYITFEVWNSSYGDTVGRFEKYAENSPETYSPFLWRKGDRTENDIDNSESKPYVYDENTVTWLTFSKTDYEAEREAVKEWLKDELDTMKDAMGESYYEPTIFIAKYDIDNNGTEDFLTYICHIGYTGSAGSEFCIMYSDGTNVIGEEYIANFRLDETTLENEGNKQVGIFPINEYYNDLSILGDMWVCFIRYGA